jgi:PAS domain S-box-containing protein
MNRTGFDRVLVADSDAAAASTLSSWLEGRGYEVETSSDGAEAWRKVCLDRFKIVILDWALPEMDVLDVCRRIRASDHLAYTYVVLLTAKNESDDRLHALLNGADDYLVKPIDPDELASRLFVARRMLTIHEDLHRLSLVARHTNSGVIISDPGGRIEWFNDAFSRMSGFSADELCESTLGDMLPGLLDPRCKERLMEQNRVHEEISGWSKDGQQYWAEVECTAIRDGSGQLTQIIAIVADTTERKQHQQHMRRQFERITALRAIDVALNFSKDLSLTLAILLDQVPSHLGIHAAAIFRRDPDTSEHLFLASRGLPADLNPCLPQLRGMIERCLPSAEPDEPMLASLGIYEDPADDIEVGADRFRAHFSLPLVTNGKVVGSLEVFHHEPLELDTDKTEFLQTLAGQAAVAIENASLFDDLLRSSAELAQAYDATIEGWSRALDLRDNETEGHSERVTVTTLRLAEAYGFSQEDLVHIRRGALLHDIGKMGIPDNILLKPGPLTDPEWELMRKHPVYAYDMLSPLSFLRASLDIPYCHHEKWDGTGYPRGLRGEEIPLSARLFAVVDVWDALRSDRPYRKGWPHERIVEHIRSLAGIHFEPGVVDVFLRVIEEERQASDALQSRAA